MGPKSNPGRVYSGSALLDKAHGPQKLTRQVTPDRGNGEERYEDEDDNNEDKSNEDDATGYLDKFRPHIKYRICPCNPCRTDNRDCDRVLGLCTSCQTRGQPERCIYLGRSRVCVSCHKGKTKCDPVLGVCKRPDTRGQPERCTYLGPGHSCAPYRKNRTKCDLILAACTRCQSYGVPEECI